VDSTGWASGIGGWIVTRLQTGHIQQYIIGFIAVTAGLVAWVVFHM